MLEEIENNFDEDMGDMVMKDLEEEERVEGFNTRYCPFNFQPVCAGSSYGYFECPKNPERCQYNINDKNFMEDM